MKYYTAVPEVRKLSKWIPRAPFQIPKELILTGIINRHVIPFMILEWNNELEKKAENCFSL